MRLVFIDDSERLDPPRAGLGHLVAYGGVIVPESALAPFAEPLVKLRVELGLPAGTEFKWNPPKNHPLHRKTAEQALARRTMLEAAASLEIKSVVVVADLSLLPGRDDQAERELLAYLYERVTMCLANEAGVIVADEPGGGAADGKLWLARSLKLTDNGTAYVRPEAIVLPIVSAPSHHVPHLQLADLVVAATTAAIAGSPYGLEYVPLLHQLAHKNAAGYAGGTGIKICPDVVGNPKCLINLRHWVFGENSFCRTGSGSGAPLPYAKWGWPYVTGSGLPDR